MPTAAVTSKGQVTIPKEIRDFLDLRDGDRLSFRVREDGVVELRALNVDISRWFGAIRPEVAGVSLEDMDPGSAER